MTGTRGSAHSASVSLLPSSGISPAGRDGSAATIVSIASWIAFETGDDERGTAAAEVGTAEADMMKLDKGGEVLKKRSARAASVDHMTARQRTRGADKSRGRLGSNTMVRHEQ